MESWHQMRLSRAKEQYIYVKSFDSVDGAFIFTVHGVSDVYIVQVEENIEIGWPPQCDCEDYYWRPGVLCKHILLCLSLMGVDEGDLEDSCWEGPTQEEMYEYLSNAPECVGCGIAVSPKEDKASGTHPIVKSALDEENKQDDALLRRVWVQNTIR